MPPLNWLARLRQNTSGNPARGGDTSLQVVSVSPSSAKRSGGGTATLKGFNFRNSPDGSVPAITIDGVAASGVVLVDANTLTFTIPAQTSVGNFDIVVTIGTNTGTLREGFTVYGETILALSPTYGPISGGTQVTVRGVNFDPTQNYRVVFGDADATDVSVMDDKTIICTSPNHPTGFANVYLETPNHMFAPGLFSSAIFDESLQAENILSTLKNGFQFTLLVRGEDIRRNPGISISESLGAPPSTASFRIDGSAPAPAGGEKIAIIDSEDDDRTLWAGTVQTVEQVYEGQTDQLAWDTKCVDFTWLANRKRPVGAWFQTSASQVVKEIIQKFCPGFTTVHVQTNLAKVTVILDGSKDLVGVLNDIATQIGGGHWYFDFSQDLHFFHIVPTSISGGVIGPPVPVGPPPVVGYITLYNAGAAPQLLAGVTDGYYSIRCQMIYSDGVVGALGLWSNLVRFNGSQIMGLNNIPIGAPIGSRTVVKRRLWFHRLGSDPADTVHKVFPFCEIGDNTTTQFTTIFGAVGASVASVTAIDQGSDNPSVAPVVALGTYWGVGNSHTPYSVAPFTFSYTFIRSDGTESLQSPVVTLSDADSTHGWDCTIPVGGAGIVKRRLYIACGGVTRWLEVSDNVTTLIQNQSNGGTTPYALYSNVNIVLAAQNNFPSAIVGVGLPPSVANAPEAGNPNNPPGPGAAPSAAVSSQLNGDPYSWASCWHSYRYAYLYRDGSISVASPPSAPVGDQYLQRGYYMTSARVGLTPGPRLNDAVDCIARITYTCQGVLANGQVSESRPDPPGFPVGYGGGNPLYLLKDPDWKQMVDRGFNVVPDNTSDHTHHVRTGLGLDPFFGATPTNDPNSNISYWSRNDPSGADFPANPANTGAVVCTGETTPVFTKGDTDFQFTPDPIPAWPNDDGPNLEGDNLPDDIDDDNMDLLHEDSGSQPFKVTTDISQIRNRIFVIGSGSTLTQPYVASSVRVYVGDITSFALGGGRIRIEDPSGVSEFAFYKTLQQDKGVPYIELTTPLSFAYTANSVVYNFYQADDVESQKFLAKYELDAFGRPTDGIHEYTITDSSLKTVWQLYMRSQAELELYSKPIITVTYASRDPKSRIGRMVHVDLTSPPCQGDFLIQSVTIDQIRDEGDQLAPRYTVRASSIRYELNDLLLRILGMGGNSSVSAGGISNAGASGALDGGSTSSTSFPKAREVWAVMGGSGPTGCSWQTVGCTVSQQGSGGTLAYDTSELTPYADNWRGDQRQSAWGTLSTSTTQGSQSFNTVGSGFCGFLEDLVDVWFELRTGKSLTGLIYHVGGFAFIPNTDFGTNIGFISIGYKQGTDSGWTLRMQTPTNGGNRTLAVPTGIGIAAATQYVIRIQSFWDGADYRTMRVVFTVNGVSYSMTQAASYVTVANVSQSAMPTSGGLVSNGFVTLGWGLGVTSLVGGTARKINARRIYLTSSGV